MSELDTTLGIDFISDCQDHVQIKILRIIRTVTRIRYVCTFCTCTFILKFSHRIDAANVSAYDSSVCLEKRRQLLPENAYCYLIIISKSARSG